MVLLSSLVLEPVLRNRVLNLQFVVATSKNSKDRTQQKREN